MSAWLGLDVLCVSGKPPSTCIAILHWFRLSEKSCPQRLVGGQTVGSPHPGTPGRWPVVAAGIATCRWPFLSQTL